MALPFIVQWPRYVSGSEDLQSFPARGLGLFVSMTCSCVCLYQHNINNEWWTEGTASLFREALTCVLSLDWLMSENFSHTGKQNTGNWSLRILYICSLIVIYSNCFSLFWLLIFTFHIPTLDFIYSNPFLLSFIAHVPIRGDRGSKVKHFFDCWYYFQYHWLDVEFIFLVTLFDVYYPIPT